MGVRFDKWMLSLRVTCRLNNSGYKQAEPYGANETAEAYGGQALLDFFCMDVSRGSYLIDTISEQFVIDICI